MCFLQVGTDKLDTNMLAVISLTEEDQLPGDMVDILEAVSRRIAERDIGRWVWETRV
jgi:hypothetical protein